MCASMCVYACVLYNYLSIDMRSTPPTPRIISLQSLRRRCE